MIYTSGVIRDLTRPETLEELQDNKLKLVCEKLDLQPNDTLLDIGCGWGTLSAFAAANYGCDVTGGAPPPPAPPPPSLLPPNRHVTRLRR